MERVVRSLLAEGGGIETPAALATSTHLPANLESGALEYMHTCALASQLDEICVVLDLLFSVYTKPQSDDTEGASETQVIIPYMVQKRAFDALPLHDAVQLWRYVETRASIWKETTTNYIKATVVHLRLVRSFLDRLDPVIDSAVIARVHFYLAQTFGPGHSARLNKKSRPNTMDPNPPGFENEEAASEGYRTFWELQGLMRNLGQITSLSSFLDVLDRVAALNQVGRVQPPPVPELGAVWDTSPAAFIFQVADPKMWTTVCVQVLISLDYLLMAAPDTQKSLRGASNSISVIPKTAPLSDTDTMRIRQARNQWEKLLGRSVSSNDNTRHQVLKALLELDRDWVDWKLAGCPVWPSFASDKAIEDLNQNWAEMVAALRAPSPSYPYGFGDVNVANVMKTPTGISRLKNAGKPSHPQAEAGRWLELRETHELGSWADTLAREAAEPEPELPDIPEYVPPPPPPRSRATTPGSTTIPSAPKVSQENPVTQSQKRLPQQEDLIPNKRPRLNWEDDRTHDRDRDRERNREWASDGNKSEGESRPDGFQYRPPARPRGETEPPKRRNDDRKAAITMRPGRSLAPY